MMPLLATLAMPVVAGVGVVVLLLAVVMVLGRRL